MPQAGAGSLGPHFGRTPNFHRGSNDWYAVSVVSLERGGRNSSGRLESPPRLDSPGKDRWDHRVHGLRPAYSTEGGVSSEKKWMLGEDGEWIKENLGDITFGHHSPMAFSPDDWLYRDDNSPFPHPFDSMNPLDFAGDTCQSRTVEECADDTKNGLVGMGSVVCSRNAVVGRSRRAKLCDDSGRSTLPALPTSI